MEQIFYIFAAVLATLGLSALYLQRASVAAEKKTRDKDARINELEKSVHLVERDFLAERNVIEIRHSELTRVAREQAFEQGRLQGLGERTAEHANEIEKQRLELLAKVESMKEAAASEARERLRAEYELQSKLFTVAISPYVKIGDKRGILSKEHETLIGYQYQLLINGIPAFTPHVVIERTEIRKEINEKVEALLIDSAQLAADAAISLYLGSAPQFARRGPPLIKRAN